MAIDFSLINRMSIPSIEQLGTTPEHFLLSLTAPTIIDIPGKNHQKWRVITTLLHGNEPSGFIALHQWLTKLVLGKLTSQTNVRIIIGSVEAAQLTPLFSHRYLSGGKDINRCFTSIENSNNTSDYFQRASLIKQAIEEVNAEAIIDLHNTSGSGPAFGVATQSNHNSLALTSLFCDTLIISHIHIGALMECNFAGQIITVECGGCNDEHAHKTAFNGIKKFISAVNLIHSANTHPINVIFKPLRLRLASGVTLNYGTANNGSANVILKADIEKYNYHIAHKKTEIGWVNKQNSEMFLLINEYGQNIFNDYFKIENNRLVCKTDLKFFMATKIKDIALNDCLFYVVKSLAL